MPLHRNGLCFPSPGLGGLFFSRYIFLKFLFMSFVGLVSLGINIFAQLRVSFTQDTDKPSSKL
jgi:hypothetical protein